MSIVKAPTKAELEALKQDIHKRRSAIMDKCRVFGMTSIEDMQMEVLNKSYDKVELQLNKIYAHEQAIKDSPGAGTQDDINWDL